MYVTFLQMVQKNKLWVSVYVCVLCGWGVINNKANIFSASFLKNVSLFQH